MAQIVVTYKFNNTGLCSSQETDTGISKSILDILWSILLLLDLRHFPNPRHEQHWWTWNTSSSIIVKANLQWIHLRLSLLALPWLLFSTWQWEGWHTECECDIPTCNMLTFFFLFLFLGNKSSFNSIYDIYFWLYLSFLTINDFTN